MTGGRGLALAPVARGTPAGIGKQGLDRITPIGEVGAGRGNRGPPGLDALAGVVGQSGTTPVRQVRQVPCQALLAGTVVGDFRRKMEADEPGLGANLGRQGIVAVGRIVQQGGRIEAKSGGWLTFRGAGGWARVKAVEIPARPFLGVDAGDETAIGRIVDDYLAEPLQ